MIKKQCFLISPIGEEGSESRIFADKVRAFLKYEVLTELEYDCIRADDKNKLGRITSDVIAHIIDSDLVIAVLENNNANVYYELALRHATTKPYISIASREKVNNKEEGLPFDTQQERVFKYPLNDMLNYTDGYEIESAALVKFKNQLKNIIKTYNEQKYEYQNPVTAALHKAILPKGMTMQGVITHIDEKIDLFHKDIDRQLDAIYDVTNSWMPKHIESLVGDMYRNGSAMYISGEKEVFDTLCEMTKKAEHQLEPLDLHHKLLVQAIVIFLKQYVSLVKRKM